MRRALLVGVTEYVDQAITSFPDVIRRDFALLQDALSSSGYEEIRATGLEQSHDRTRTRILDSIGRFVASGKRGDTLLIYLSGHGLHHAGIDYLVPAEAVTGDPSRYPDYLVPLDFANIVEASSADNVFFFVDCCRQGIKTMTKGAYAIGWSEGERKKVREKGYAIVFACQSGGDAHYETQPEPFSFFARALAQCLSADHPATTLLEVFEETARILEELCVKYDRTRQYPRYVVESGAGESDVLARIFCDGPDTAGVGFLGSDPWVAASTASELWRVAGNTPDPWKKAVGEVVHFCYSRWLAYQAAFPADAWRDLDLPRRTLDRISMLLHRCPVIAELTPTEVAHLVVAPFIREAVLAEALLELSASQPFSLEATGQGSETPRGRLEQRHQAYPRLTRKGAGLFERGRTDEGRAVAAWLMYRAVFESLDSGAARDRHFAPDSGLSSPLLDLQLAVELSRCLYGDPERIDRSDRPNALDRESSVGGHADEHKVRPRLLGYVLGVAGRLAMDARLLPDVIVDHIGLSDGITPAQVREGVQAARWVQSEQVLTLDARCTHPAMDLALRLYIDEASTIVGQISDKVFAGGEDLEAIRDLPNRLTSSGVKPALDADSDPVYELPHVRFHLAQDEVREILMGTQLYGKPGLAIRELYQNALDACRYRRARSVYLTHTSQATAPVTTWNPAIEFIEGTDERGRRFIECIDNGVGMGKRELAECFARAGRRFHDTPEFLEEQAEWQASGSPAQLYPNSRFGIGVFSYFMIADELEIETCRIDRKGRPGSVLRAIVTGSGALFRITEHPEIPHDGGTRIRLYIDPSNEEANKLEWISELTRVLWVAEFPVRAVTQPRMEAVGPLGGGEGKVVEWEPGVLRHPSLKRPKICEGSHPNLWWVDAELYSFASANLSDGVYVDAPIYASYIIDFRDSHRPALTVDRNKTLNIDEAYVRDLLETGWQTLLDWQELTLTWLWKLSERCPTVVDRIAAGLLETGRRIPVGNTGVRVAKIEQAYALAGRVQASSISAVEPYSALRVSVREVGCWPGDYRLFALLDLFGSVNDVPVAKLKEYLAYEEKPGDQGAEHFGRVLYARSLAWRKAGLRVPDEILDALFVGGLEDCPTLYPSDKFLLRTASAPDTGDLLQYGSETRTTLRACVLRCKQLSPLWCTGGEVMLRDGTILPDPDTVDDTLIVLSDEAALLERNSWPIRTKDISPRRFLSFAAEAKISLYEASARLQRLTPLGFIVPSGQFGGIDIVPTAHLAGLWAEDGAFQLVQAMRHAVASGLSLGEVLREAVALVGPIREVTPGSSPYGALLALPVVDSEHFDSYFPTTTDLYYVDQIQLGPSYIIDLAVKHGASLSSLCDRYGHLRPLGLKLPAADENQTVTLIEDDKLLLNHVGKIDLLSLSKASATLGKPVGEMIERARVISTLGVQLPDLARVKDASTVLSPEDVAYLDRWYDEIGVQQVVRGCLANREDPAAAAKRLERLRSVGWDGPSLEAVSAFYFPKEFDLAFGGSNTVSARNLFAYTADRQLPIDSVRAALGVVAKMGARVPRFPDKDLPTKREFQILIANSWWSDSGAQVWKDVTGEMGGSNLLRPDAEVSFSALERIRKKSWEAVKVSREIPYLKATAKLTKASLDEVKTAINKMIDLGVAEEIPAKSLRPLSVSIEQEKDVEPPLEPQAPAVRQLEPEVPENDAKTVPWWQKLIGGS